jgi:hypothetical protein
MPVSAARLDAARPGSARESAAPASSPRTLDEATLILRAIRERMSRDERFRAVWEPLLRELER